MHMDAHMPAPERKPPCFATRESACFAVLGSLATRDRVQGACTAPTETPLPCLRLRRHAVPQRPMTLLVLDETRRIWVSFKVFSFGERDVPVICTTTEAQLILKNC